ncbi:hypothetical protein [Kibdelosporangium aridum]|uniref:hypothetical protein n=1 Tax=Kibdelosporangium aridum TaxID=2030 RepID=UPI00117ABAEB|nr:hypothetical protein [Kibdelosporangium aridum]
MIAQFLQGLVISWPSASRFLVRSWWGSGDVTGVLLGHGSPHWEVAAQVLNGLAALDPEH